MTRSHTFESNATFQAARSLPPFGFTSYRLRVSKLELELALSKRIAKRALSIPGKVAFDSNVWSERAKTGKTTA